MDRRSISSNLAYLVFGLFLVVGLAGLAAVAAFAPPPNDAILTAVKTTKTTTSAVPSGTAPENVRALFGAKCLSCHQAPGINGGGAIGPNLAGIASRQIAGVLPPTLDNMRRWLDDPPAVKPGTAMPKVPKTPEEVDLLANYLMTLQ